VRLPEADHSSAVLIGTATYRSAGLPDLPAVRRNLTDLAAALTDSATGPFPTDRCTVLKDPRDARTVSHKLLQAAAAAHDTLLIYFAGHGLLSRHSNELYLALPDTDRDNPWFTALRYDDLRQLLLDNDRFHATNRILILDCGFSGRAIPDTAGGRLSGLLDIEGSYVLAATGPNVPTHESSDARHTPFTGELLAMLRTGVPDGPELLTLSTVYEHIRRAMAGRGLPRPEQVNSHTVADLALARNRAYAPPAAEPTPARDLEATGPSQVPPRRRPWSLATRRRIAVLALALLIAVSGLGVFSLVGGRSGPTPVHVSSHVINALAFSPNGKMLASAGDDDGTIRLWDVTTHRLAATLNGYPVGVTSLAFSPNGTTLAAAGLDPVQLWDVATRKPLGPLTPTTRIGWVYSLAFSPDGRTLATGGDKTVQLWDIASRRPIGDALTGHPNNVVGVAYRKDGRILASAGQFGSTVRLWDTATHQQIGEAIIGGDVVAFSPDGKALATTGGGSSVQLWDVETRQQLGVPIAVDDVTTDVNALAFSPNGRNIAVTGWASVHLLDVPSQRHLAALPTGDNQTVTTVAFSPDGNTIASGEDNGTIRFWDVANRRQIGEPCTVPTATPIPAPT
jgi:dipeptidyl aminopeptidase/acylaminoacyl peptidase